MCARAFARSQLLVFAADTRERADACACTPALGGMDTTKQTFSVLQTVFLEKVSQRRLEQSVRQGDFRKSTKHHS